MSITLDKDGNIIYIIGFERSRNLLNEYNKNMEDRENILNIYSDGDRIISNDGYVGVVLISDNNVRVRYSTYTKSYNNYGDIKDDSNTDIYIDRLATKEEINKSKIFVIGDVVSSIEGYMIGVIKSARYNSSFKDYTHDIELNNKDITKFAASDLELIHGDLLDIYDPDLEVLYQGIAGRITSINYSVEYPILIQAGTYKVPCDANGISNTGIRIHVLDEHGKIFEYYNKEEEIKPINPQNKENMKFKLFDVLIDANRQKFVVVEEKDNTIVVVGEKDKQAKVYNKYNAESNFTLYAPYIEPDVKSDGRAPACKMKEQEVSEEYDPEITNVHIQEDKYYYISVKDLKKSIDNNLIVSIVIDDDEVFIRDIYDNHFAMETNQFKTLI